MHNLKTKISCFPQLDWLIVLTSQSQGEGWWLDILWRDWTAGVRSSMLLVKAVDDHPLLIGAEVQSIPVCRVSYHLYSLRDSIPFEYKQQPQYSHMHSKRTCTVQGSVPEQHILWPDNLQTQFLQSQTCWQVLQDAPAPGGLNTQNIRTYTEIPAAWVYCRTQHTFVIPEMLQQFWFVWTYLLHQVWWCSGRSTCPMVGPSQTWSGTRLHRSASQPESGLNSWNSCLRCSWSNSTTSNNSFLRHISTVCHIQKNQSVFSPTVCVHGMTGWSRWGQCGEWTPCGRLQTHGTTWPASQCDLWTTARTPVLTDLNLVTGKSIL